MGTTTIKITTLTKRRMLSIKNYPRETYEEIINRLLNTFDSIKEKEVNEDEY